MYLLVINSITLTVHMYSFTLFTLNNQKNVFI